MSANCFESIAQRSILILTFSSFPRVSLSNFFITHLIIRECIHKIVGQVLSVGSPNTCTMEFVEDLERSRAFFARKFDMNVDSEIVEYFCKKTGVLF